jgi:hypothetical protein
MITNVAVIASEAKRSHVSRAKRAIPYRKRGDPLFSLAKNNWGTGYW